MLIKDLQKRKLKNKKKEYLNTFDKVDFVIAVDKMKSAQ